MNAIGSEGAAFLGEHLYELPDLRTLDLRHNAIDDEGALALAKALGNQTHIEEVRLEGNAIGKAGKDALLSSAQISKMQLSV